MYIDEQQKQQNNTILQYLDCHTHLLDYPQQNDIDNVINNSLNHGVKYIVVNTTTTNQFDQLFQLMHRYPVNIIAAFGIHPCFLSIQQSIEKTKQLHNLAINQNPNENNGQIKLGWVEQLQNILKKKQQYTVGEIGLDFRKDILQLNPKQLQMHYFKTQLDMAIRLKRPVTIHCVRAHGQMLKILKDINKKIQNDKPHLIMHSYGGSTDMTKSFLKLSNLNIFFSLCLKRSVDLCSVIPIQKLICETDAPFQSNCKLLQQENRINYNKYFYKVKETIKNKETLNDAVEKQQTNINIQQTLSKMDTNQPVNIITNVKSLVKYYKMDQIKFTKIIYENSLRALKLIK